MNIAYPTVHHLPNNDHVQHYPIHRSTTLFEYMLCELGFIAIIDAINLLHMSHNVISCHFSIRFNNIKIFLGGSLLNLFTTRYYYYNES
jgi:hypothetical protein